MLLLTTSSSPKTSTFRLLTLFSLVLTFSSEIKLRRRRMLRPGRTASSRAIVVELARKNNPSPFENPTPGEWLPNEYAIGPDYDWTASTEDNYRSDIQKFRGPFRKIRERLDYNFHAHYSLERQELQDYVIQSILDGNDRDEVKGRHCRVPPNPWVVFTAGVMGAGKSYTIRRLHEQGLFPLESFVWVDPDEIRRLLPEFEIYLQKIAENAGAMTRKEAGMMAEIISEASLERGQNVLKDGSLRDADWYKNYFSELRIAFPDVRLGIIHVTAPMDVILERVKERAKQTGRIVPRDVLEKAAEQVPKSVKILQSHVDFFVEIDNSGKKDGAILARGMSVTTVKESLNQTCVESGHSSVKMIRNKLLL